MKLTHFPIFLLLLFTMEAFGQEDCALILSKAQKLYDAGQIEQIQLMLQPCIKNGFTKEEIQTAQKLIIQANLFDKNVKSADSAMLQFLRKYPEYEIIPSDQAEFVQLFETYQTRPVASLGLLGGLNYSFVSPSYIYNIRGKYSVPTFGLQGGVGVTITLSGKYDLSLEFIYQQQKYTHSISDTNAYGVSSNNLFDETQSNLLFPLSAIYTPFSFKNIAIFGRAGITFGYMINSVANLKIDNDPKYTNISLINYRNPFQIWPLIGAGIKFSLPHSHLLLEARYNHGTMEQAVIESEKAKVITEFGDAKYSHNGFFLYNLAINIGFFYKFYIPRKNNPK